MWIKQTIESMAYRTSALIEDYSETPTTASFRTCCIGHSTYLAEALKADGLEFRVDDLRFIVVKRKTLNEPRVTEVVNMAFGSDERFDMQLKVSFDSSVAKYASELNPEEHDQGMEGYQQTVEDIEERVIQGVFGSTRPEPVAVMWVQESLHIMWRSE